MYLFGSAVELCAVEATSLSCREAGVCCGRDRWNQLCAQRDRLRGKRRVAQHHCHWRTTVVTPVLAVAPVPPVLRSALRTRGRVRSRRRVLRRALAKGHERVQRQRQAGNQERLLQSAHSIPPEEV